MRSKTFFNWVIVIPIIFINSTLVAKKTASIKAYGLHAFLDAGISSLGGTLYYTTFDGLNSWPLNDSGYISGELKRSSAGSSTFVTDYLAADYYGVYEYGSVSLNFPTTDSDFNGVPDWLQKNMSVNAAVTGNSQLHYVSQGFLSANANISGKFTRSSGLSSGNYNLTYNISGLGSGTATGVWYVGFYEGTIEYDETTYSIDAKTLNAEGRSVSATGTSEFSINDLNNLNIGVINLTIDGEKVQLQAGTLARSGTVYSGFAKAIDGNPATSWADYVDWYLEIEDPNDTDSDGVPDFTDPVSASPVVQALDAGEWNWHKWPWVYNNNTKSWLYYFPKAFGEYWVFNSGDGKWYSFNKDSEIWFSEK